MRVENLHDAHCESLKALIMRRWRAGPPARGGVGAEHVCGTCSRHSALQRVECAFWRASSAECAVDELVKTTSSRSIPLTRKEERGDGALE